MEIKERIVTNPSRRRIVKTNDPNNTNDNFVADVSVTDEAVGSCGTSCFRERLVDTFIHRVILFDDKIIIVYNIKNDNNESITIEEILNDFNDSTVFGYDCVGDPDGNRTRDTTVKG